MKFDSQALAARVRAQRGTRALRAVARELPTVSASTLSRVERGICPDMDTFLSLCDWLGALPQVFFVDGVPPREVGALERIEVALRTDTCLPREFVDALVQLIRLFHPKENK